MDRALEPTDVTVVSARCDELGRDLPLQPIADALAAALDASGGAIEVSAADRLLLAESLGLGSAPATPPSEADSEPPATQLFAAMLRVMEALAAGRPFVVAVDHLHLAGRSTVQWLAFVTRRTRGGVLILGTRRTTGSGQELPGALVHRIGPLEIDAVRALVGDAGAGELLEVSGGNPLLLWAFRDAEGGPIASSVRDAVEHHLHGLGPAAESVRTAAVLGQHIDLDLLASVLQSSAADVLERLRPVDEWTGAMAWHQGHRLDLARSCAALTGGDPPTARTLAERVRADALVRGARRYAAIADCVLLAAGPSGDERVAEVGAALGRTADSEAWWLVALIADRWGSDVLRREAQSRAAHAIRSAGVHGSTLARWVDRVLA